VGEADVAVGLMFSGLSALVTDEVVEEGWRLVVRARTAPGPAVCSLIERRGGDLDEWMKQVREAGLTELGPFLRGLDQDHDAAVAGLTVPYSNGPIEGVNTKTKLINGRASFQLLRHRILLA